MTANRNVIQRPRILIRQILSYVNAPPAVFWCCLPSSSGTGYFGGILGCCLINCCLSTAVVFFYCSCAERSQPMYRTCAGIGPRYWRTFDGLEFTFEGQCTYTLFDNGIVEISVGMADCTSHHTCLKVSSSNETHFLVIRVYFFSLGRQDSLMWLYNIMLRLQLQTELSTVKRRKLSWFGRVC